MLWWIAAPDTISAHDVSVKILRRFRAEHTPQDFQKNRAVCRLAFGFSGPPCFQETSSASDFWGIKAILKLWKIYIYICMFPIFFLKKKLLISRAGIWHPFHLTTINPHHKPLDHRSQTDMFSETIVCPHRHVSLPGSSIVAPGWSSWSSSKKNSWTPKSLRFFPEKKHVYPAPGQQILVPIIYIIIYNYM